MDRSVINFLIALKTNNNREWFQKNKAWYEAVRKEVETLVDQQLIPGLAVLDPKLKLLTAKQCMFRIYRDVRFSTNKDPYKTYFGAYIGTEGRKSSTGYYLHIEPDHSFVGGGSHSPETPILKAIRSEIYFQSDNFKQIIQQDEFLTAFGELQGEKLKRPPKGFPSDFHDIELLKLKEFTVMHSLENAEILQAGFDKKVMTIFQQMKAFNSFLSKAIENIE